MTLSRALNACLALLVAALGAILVVRHTRAEARPEPTFEELHASALAKLEASAPDAPAALERARASIEDPDAAALYARAIADLAAGRREQGEFELTCAVRAARERETEW